MNQMAKVLVLFGMLCLLQSSAFAIVAPHDATNDVDCEHCHISHQSLGSYGYDNMCLTCHKAGSGSKAAKFPFAPGHAANPFGTYTSTPPNNRISVSHTWIGRENVPRAAAERPRMLSLNKNNVAGALSCAKCHNIHAPRSSASNSAPFLRGYNERDEMCFDCHRSWKVSSHLSGTHPVNFNYTGASSKVMTRAAEYYNPPRNAAEANPTSEMKLKKGGVVCSTCHGVHYADSNSATFDTRTSVLVPKKGMLLRTDLKGDNPNDVNICTGCHKGKFAHNRKGQNVQCADCHSAHVTDGTPGGPNVYLVRRFVNISTQFGAVRNKSILFRYTGAARNYVDMKGVCVTCHVVPTAGGMYPGEHSSTTDARVCNSCHFHNNYIGSFSGGCTSCHGLPPTRNEAGGPWGYGAGYSGIDESTTPHRRHAAGGDDYSITCDECHKGNAHNSTPRSYQDVFLSKAGIRAGAAATYNTATRGCSTMYCHSNAEPFDRTAAYKSVTWGGRVTMTCTSCHNDASDTSELSGRHTRHAGASGYAYACDKCHSATATGSTAIRDRALHVNKVKDVAFKEGGAYDSGTRSCSNTYCHSDALGHPGKTVRWTDTATLACYDCHKGRTADSTPDNCAAIGGTWETKTITVDGVSSVREYCTPYINMTSNGHGRLVGPQWIRKYPCYYCHYDTVNVDGSLKDKTKHADGVKTVAMAPEWYIVGQAPPSYNPVTKECDNVYCHSDGTTAPEKVKGFGWNKEKAECNACHGHPIGSCSSSGCHDGGIRNGKLWEVKADFPAGSQWMAAMPMFPNEGAGRPRANSHARHTETSFTCDNCHYSTIRNGACTTCHSETLGKAMGEASHIDPAYHVNKIKDVVFKGGGSYNDVTKKCSNTACHTGGTDPVWGGSVSNAVTCLGCHGTTEAENDDYGAFNGVQARINTEEWTTLGHGLYSSATRGHYVSGNPAANFPGNPCWYCHDNNILHKDAKNPYRLRMHAQYERRFEKECVYCHMVGSDAECLKCHDDDNSLAPHIDGPGTIVKHSGNTYMSGCLGGTCHTTDATIHKTRAGFWKQSDKDDIKNQYMMMGVCLQCHDDDTGGQCVSCHTPPADNPKKYELGFDPGTGYVKPRKARASSSHFGYKHYRAWVKDEIWKGGKFCWDCHDPHGDKDANDTGNIYMIQNKVATRTEGKFGIPAEGARAPVAFTGTAGGDYASASGAGKICNVCHSPGSRHYTQTSGDGHNGSRRCTECHEHRFADSHASKDACNTCHTRSKPVPKHGAFGLPRDCTKCHGGAVNKRMDVMSQMKGNSHHVQGTPVTKKHCYACHWEANENGLIDITYHEGYNYMNYSTARNYKVDLVVWQPNPNPAKRTVAVRPITYKNVTTAVQFLATKVGTPGERAEAAKLNNHCLSCHSDQNNDGTPFDDDCRTPRQYAWDYTSIAARYSNMSTTTWGKYADVSQAAKKTVAKALSAHGNAVNNAGGFRTDTGVDEDIPNTRAGAQNVQCFDCHSSHGSKVVGVTSSYPTFNGTKNGANLKETQAGKGGYGMNYKAQPGPSSGINMYNPGAAQCFDCHETATTSNLASDKTPWGYATTFGASAPIIGYRDTPKFGQGDKAAVERFNERKNGRKTMISSHLRTGTGIKAPANAIDGLCTPCHDPHGVSPTLGNDKQYGVPLLRGTWVTSPYKEDRPAPEPFGLYTAKSAVNGKPVSWGKIKKSDYRDRYPSPTQPFVNYRIDRNTFASGQSVRQDDSQFAGLCLTCHKKEEPLWDGGNQNSDFRTVDRVHETVKGWGKNAEHSYTCSKCHQPHNSGLPRLMQTNCLDHKHRGGVTAGGLYHSANKQTTLAGSRGNVYRGFPIASLFDEGTDAVTSCHANTPKNSGTWPDFNFWNVRTPW